MAFTETINLLFRSQGTGKVKRDVRQIETSMKRASTAVKSMMGPLAGIGAAYAMVSATKKVMAFDKALTQLSIQGHISSKEQTALRQRILETSTSTGVARDEILAFSQGVTDASGNIQLAADSMMAVAMATQVTAADSMGLGTIVSDLGTKFNIAGSDMDEALSVLISQGEKGRLTLNELARVAPTLFSAKTLGSIASGVDGVRDLGAMVQVMRQGFGSAEETTTGLVTAMSKLIDPSNAKKLAAIGVSAMGDDGTLRKGIDILLDTVEASKGSVDELTGIYGVRAIRGILPFVKIYKDHGNSIEAVRSELDKYRNVTGSARDLQNKFNRQQKSAATGAEKLSAAWENLTTTVFTGANATMIAEALDNFAISLNWSAGVVRETMNDWRDILGLDKKAVTDLDLAEGSQASKARKGGEGGTLARTIAGKAVTGVNDFQTSDMLDFLVTDMERSGTMNAPITASKGYKKKKALSHLKGMEKKSPEQYNAFLEKYALSKQGTEGFGAATESLTSASAPSKLEFKATIFNEVPGVGISMEVVDGNGKGVKPSTEGI